MPYKSKAERERELWMTRTEAVALIAKLDRCDRSSAFKQLKHLLGDRELRIKWDDQKPISSPPTIGVEARDAMDWGQARFRRDKVFDPWTRQWRTFLIFKNDILRHWEESPVASAAPESGQAAEKDNAGPIPKANRGGRPSAKKEIYQALDRLSHQGHRVTTMARMQSAKLVASACGKRIGDRGWSRSIVLKHIGSGLKRLPVPDDPEPKEQ